MMNLIEMQRVPFALEPNLFKHFSYSVSAMSRAW